MAVEILPVLQALKCTATALSVESDDMYVSVSNVNFPVMQALITNIAKSAKNNVWLCVQSSELL